MQMGIQRPNATTVYMLDMMQVNYSQVPFSTEVFGITSGERQEPVTFGFDIRVTDQSITDGVLMSVGSNTANFGTDIWMTTGGVLHARASNGATEMTQTLTNGPYRIAIAISGAEAQLSIDGTVVATGTAGSPWALNSENGYGQPSGSAAWIPGPQQIPIVGARPIGDLTIYVGQVPHNF
mgnify:CR=1 FL=1